jgi:hypothetical protein
VVADGRVFVQTDSGRLLAFRSVPAATPADDPDADAGP